MNRRELIKRMTVVPLAAASIPMKLSIPNQHKPMPALHREAFVMDGHTHVMTRELLMHTEIGQRYTDGNVDLPRAKEGGVDAMFFSVYTPENYYPGRFETKNTLRVVN